MARRAAAHDRGSRAAYRTSRLQHLRIQQPAKIGARQRGAPCSPLRPAAQSQSHDRDTRGNTVTAQRYQVRRRTRPAPELVQEAPGGPPALSDSDTTWPVSAPRYRIRQRSTWRNEKGLVGESALPVHLKYGLTGTALLSPKPRDQATRGTVEQHSQVRSV